MTAVAVTTNPAASHALHPLRFGQEVRATIKLAAPLAVAQLSQMGMALTDTILLGALGPDALAAGGLGASLYMTLAGILQGGEAGTGILAAHARGANDHNRIAAVFRAGMTLALFLALPLAVILWNAESILLALGEPANLAKGVADYVAIMIFAVPASMMLGTQRSYLAAMNHPKLVMAVSMSALIVNGLLNYGLIHGAWGLPALGYLGSATATTITIWLMLIATSIGMRLSADLRAHPLLGKVSWRVVGEVGNLGWPIAITLAVEILLFLAASLMMGIIGTTALAAHQVTLMVASTSFMVPLALNQAANVRVGYYMGAHVPHAARRAASSALMLGIGFMAAMAAIMLLWPAEIAMLFNLDGGDAKDAATIALIVELLAICAFFQVFDGAQTIAAGVLRGMKDTRVPMLLAAFSYWAVGFPAAWGLGFGLGWGPHGIWWGLAIGLAFAAVLLCTRWWRLSKSLIAAAA